MLCSLFNNAAQALTLCAAMVAGSGQEPQSLNIQEVQADTTEVSAYHWAIPFWKEQRLEFDNVSSGLYTNESGEGFRIGANKFEGLHPEAYWEQNFSGNFRLQAGLLAEPAGLFDNFINTGPGINEPHYYINPYVFGGRIQNILPWNDQVNLISEFTGASNRDGEGVFSLQSRLNITSPSGRTRGTLGVALSDVDYESAHSFFIKGQQALNLPIGERSLVTVGYQSTVGELGTTAQTAVGEIEIDFGDASSFLLDDTGFSLAVYGRQGEYAEHHESVDRFGVESSLLRYIGFHGLTLTAGPQIKWDTEDGFGFGMKFRLGADIKTLGKNLNILPQ